MDHFCPFFFFHSVFYRIPYFLFFFFDFLLLLYNLDFLPFLHFFLLLILPHQLTIIRYNPRICKIHSLSKPISSTSSLVCRPHFSVKTVNSPVATTHRWLSSQLTLGSSTEILMGSKPRTD